MIKGQRPRWLAWAVLAFATFAAFACLVFVPVWLQPPLSEKELSGVPDAETRVTLQQAQTQLQNNIRSTLLQGFAGVLLLTGAVATWRQVQISREGQITERLTRAIDQIGNDKVDIRIGGIYALERLAKDSATDRLAIGEILAAFIRAHAPWPAGYKSHPEPHPTSDVDDAIPWLRDRLPDVQSAVVVLGRHTRDRRDFRLAVRRVDLRRTNFNRGTLINVDLSDANLASCWAGRVRWESCRFDNTDLRKSVLIHAILDRSDFTRAHLGEADLEGATLREANLSEASLRGTSLRNADLCDAKLTRADLRGADLTGARLAGAELIDVQADETTTWPVGFTP